MFTHVCVLVLPIFSHKPELSGTILAAYIKDFCVCRTPRLCADGEDGCGGGVTDRGIQPAEPGQPGMGIWQADALRVLPHGRGCPASHPESQGQLSSSTVSNSSQPEYGSLVSNINLDNILPSPPTHTHT